MVDSTQTPAAANVGRRVWSRVPPELAEVGPAIVVGLGTGLGAIAFRWLIGVFTTISLDWFPGVIAGWGWAYIVIAPTIGGLLVGLLIYFFAPEAKGHGVPEVMEAVALRAGRIRPIVVLIKALASSICIGSGGSVGREGPIVQIGSALGSTVAQRLNLSEDRIRNLVACGAAGGIAATFNAPIAGFIFAMEVILGDFSVRHFSNVALAAVTASVLGRVAFGDQPAFAIPQYHIQSLGEYPLYVLLGVFAALVATVYVRAVYWTEDTFDRMKPIPAYLKPMLGGALLGGVALLYPPLTGLTYERVPQVFGVGYETINVALLGTLGVTAALGLVFFKMLSTALTLGSGGSGGIFAPSLFIGAALGAGFGSVLHSAWPAWVGPIGAYALVGMGAVFAGAAHAPITAILIMFELTDDYRIILPLMLTAGVATLLAYRWMGGESIYTLKLSRRGVRLHAGRDVDVMQSVRVSEVMKRDPVTVRGDLPARALGELFLQTNNHGFAVLDQDDNLMGVVSLTDYRRVIESNRMDMDLRVIDIATRHPHTALPNETIQAVLKRMGPQDLSRVPVVDPNDQRKLVGMIRRNDIVKAYELGTVRGGRPGSGVPGLRQAQYTLDDRSLGRGKLLSEVELPRECIVASIQRAGRILIPHGDTRLESGDRVTVLLGDCDPVEVFRWFEAMPQADDET